LSTVLFCDVSNLFQTSESKTEITKLTADTEITQTGSQSLLLTNLQKLEGSGKVGSPVRDISAKDIVSGIISAANQKSKMMRPGKSGKKDSVDSASRRFSEAVSMAVDTATRLVDASPADMTASLNEKSNWSDQRFISKTESAPALGDPARKVSSKSSDQATNEVSNADAVADAVQSTKVVINENSLEESIPDEEVVLPSSEVPNSDAQHDRDDPEPKRSNAAPQVVCSGIHGSGFSPMEQDEPEIVFGNDLEAGKLDSNRLGSFSVRPIVKSESVPKQLSSLASTSYTPVYENISRSREYLSPGMCCLLRNRLPHLCVANTLLTYLLLLCDSSLSEDPVGLSFLLVNEASLFCTSFCTDHVSVA